MPPVTIPTIDPVPDPPSRSDTREQFVTKGDATLAAWPGFVTQMNATAAAVYTNALSANTDAAAAAASAAAASASAASALNAPGTNGTSTTNTTVGTGTKVFTTQSGKAWSVGQGVVVASTASPLNQMTGIITGYTGTSLTVEVSSINGAGTFAAWTISMAAGAPLPMSSQAQAEGGTDASSVMTPLRTKQAIDKFSAKSDTRVTVATVLTAASNFIQHAAMTKRGWGFTLPAANTYAQTGPKFTFYNAGYYDLPIRDSTGAIKNFIRPNAKVTCDLLDNGTAAGTWAFQGGSVYGETAAAVYTTTILSTFTSFATVALSPTLEILAVGSSSGVKAAAYDKTTGVIGTWVSVNAINADSVNSLRLVKVSATQAVIVTANNATSTNSFEARVLTVTGSTTLAASTGTNLTTPSGARNIIFSITQMGTSWVMHWADITSLITYATAFTVGTTVTWGSNNALYTAASSSGFTPQNGAAYVSGGALVLFCKSSNDTQVYVRALTVSGTTITLGAVGTVGSADSVGSHTYKVEMLGTGRMLVAMRRNGTGQLTCALVSNSGTTLTISAEAQAGIDNGGFNDAVVSIQTVSTNKAVVLWVYTGTANYMANILTDTSGTLTAGTAITFPGVVSDVAIRGGVIGNLARFVRIEAPGTLQKMMVVSLDCSGSSPTIDEISRYNNEASSGGATQVLVSDGGANSVTPQANAIRLRSASAVISLPLPSGPTQPSRRLVYDPYPYMVPADDTCGGITNAGAVESEGWNIFTDGALSSFRKIELIT